MLPKSSFLQEFIARGYFSAATDLNSLDNLMANQPIKAYIGFDCTANSLHVGSLLQIMILRLLQKHHHHPIIVLGGGTTKIGDPSGKDEARQILSDEIINHNLSGIFETLKKFVDFSANKATFINNQSWLDNINYITFLREIGKYFSINRMLTFDSVKIRLERQQPLSFLEFNYMILQAYDFYYLHQNQHCILQIGGSDQWGNIINGVELIRKANATNDQESGQDHIAFGLTTPLLTTADGKKMGKTADGAVWLDEKLLSPFDYFQYFRNTADQDVIKFLKLFTDLPLEQIASFSNLHGSEINQAKEILAFEATKICHGATKAHAALEKARQIFLQKNDQAFEEKILDFNTNENVKLIDIILAANAVDSKGEAKRLIEGKAIKIDNQTVNDIAHSVPCKSSFNLTIGKKKFFKITLI